MALYQVFSQQRALDSFVLIAADAPWVELLDDAS